VAVVVRVGFGRISDVLKWGDGRTQGDEEEEEEEEECSGPQTTWKK
jgi:hypothetical protein